MKHLKIALLGLAASFALFNVQAQTATPTQTQAKPQTPEIILVVGDSLSAEYGIKRGSGWVQLLQKQLQDSKNPAQVINASISGDTTAGGVSRLPALMKKHQPTLVILELGGNDALRGLPLDMSTKNMNTMIQTALSGAKVLVLGIQVPPNYGSAYTRDFAKMFVQVARENKVSLVPFFLQGVADVPDSAKLFQADRIHPNEQAQAKILANVWPAVQKLVR